MFRPPLKRSDSSREKLCTRVSSLPVITGEDLDQALSHYDHAKKGITALIDSDAITALRKISSEMSYKKSPLSIIALIDIINLSARLHPEKDKITTTTLNTLLNKFDMRVLCAVKATLRVGGMDNANACLFNCLNLMAAHPTRALDIALAKTILYVLLEKADAEKVVMPIIKSCFTRLNENAELASTIMQILKDEESIEMLFSNVKSAEQYFALRMHESPRHHNPSPRAAAPQEPITAADVEKQLATGASPANKPT